MSAPIAPLLSRRDVIAGCAALGLATAADAAGEPGLAEVAARRGILFGSAVAWGGQGSDTGSFANPRYAALLERDCAVLVPENELKWQATRPGPRLFDFARMDAIADYATDRHMRLRGHTLFWVPPQWYPDWLRDHDFGSRPAQAVEAMLVEHVRTVCARYGSRIFSYDVVNEAIQPETGAIRDTVVTKALGGEAMLDLLFHSARAEAPHAQLVYNDYMSWERGTEDESHIRGVLKLLEGFRKRNTPVDALGVQSHIRLLKSDPVAAIVKESAGPWRRFLDEVVAMGFDLVITEFDVNDRKAPADIAARDGAVADYAQAYLDIMFSYPQLREMLVWGLSDRYSWLEGFDPRADKLPKRGLPYDREFRAKPLRSAIARALAGAPRREPLRPAG
ncbi:endo-1,4-beta-xylanase [Sphingomonas cannabina]|uniref:endo-1,4-beta-xylanase n=1 Tax=Sphingomonas cannabina TaxID=2899123 RepID=UPI001F2D0EF9|nr:endo-1,4-beta-xylanase [Sphingomonas cannabina]UIJ47200.1 endo-1,4-beta-xylanase [Sphingomonas cannabina]